MPHRLPIFLSLEKERVHLLFRLNIAGAFAVFIYALAFHYVSGDLISRPLEMTWFLITLALGVMRIGISWLWKQNQHKIQTLRDLRFWIVGLHIILSLSAFAFGAAAWVGTYYGSLFQQVFTAVNIIFITAGAIACWCVSPRILYTVIPLMYVPWSVGLLLADQPIVHVLGPLSIIYLVLGFRVSLSLSRFVDSSFQLRMENSLLTHDLRKQIQESERAREAFYQRDIHEAANKAKSVFLANASHEFRTPLAAIMGYVENILQNIKDGHQDPQQLQEDLITVARNGKYLSTLVSDLLDLSNMDSGNFYFEKSQMPLKPEINESVLMVKALPEAKEVGLEIHYVSELPETIRTDPMRFRQVLVSLLTSAVRFTQRKRVELYVDHRVNSQRQGQLKIRISDLGMDVYSELKEQIFEPFSRTNISKLQKFAGPGLGLALSKKLTILLGGSLEIVQTPTGTGDAIELTLNTGPIESLQFPLKSSGATPLSTLEGTRILVVDDAEDLQVLMRRYLEKHGARIETCSNGKEALDLVFSGDYDVILMDMKMPIMGGSEATRKLRQSGYKKPIIAITAHANPDDRQMALEAGCDDYLSKPVDLISLVEAIKKQWPPSPHSEKSKLKKVTKTEEV